MKRETAWFPCQRLGPQGQPPEDGPACHQLVGGVTAHKAMTASWSERTTSRTGTEILPRLLREAAVEDHSQWGKP